MNDFWQIIKDKIDKNIFPYRNFKNNKNSIEFRFDDTFKYKYVVGINDKQINYVALSIEDQPIEITKDEIFDGKRISDIFKYYIESIYQNKESYERMLLLGVDYGKIRKDYIFKTTTTKKKQYQIIVESDFHYIPNDTEKSINFFLTELYEIYNFSNKIFKNIIIAHQHGTKFLTNLYSIGLISRIQLNEYNSYKQFPEGFTLDLTYPKGHIKEGEPLRKICIIGQSGTGKTNLLQLIKEKITVFETKKDDKDLDKEATLYYGLNNYKIKFEENINFGDEIYEDLYFTNISAETVIKIAQDENNTNNSRLIYFPAEIINQIKNLNIDNDTITYNETTKIIDFSIEETTQAWRLIKKDILEYRELERAERFKLSNLILKSNEFDLVNNAYKIKDDFNKWKVENPSPVEKLAECLDPLLNRFNLKIKIDIDSPKDDDIKFLKIETEQGLELGNLEEMLSTGTKQLILSAMPLYKLKPKNAIILIDEPERSLYPDIQTEIIKFYTDFDTTKTCQFFFATHSPIIASCFEPWEIIELRYNTTCVLDEGFYQSNHLPYEILDKTLQMDYSQKYPLIKEYGIPDEVREQLAALQDIEFQNKAEFLIAVKELLEETDFQKYKKRIVKASGYGTVYQELWYNGERHVDNYTKFPEYLRWDSILTDIYGLQTDGSIERKEKLQEFSEIGLELQNLKDKEKDAPKKKELWEKYKKIAQLLKWRT